MDDLTPTQELTPEQVVARLEFGYDHACSSLREALSRYAKTGIGPTAAERRHFRYPRLDVAWHPTGANRYTTTRAWAKLQDPGVYSTTITQPAFFRAYLLEQLQPLVSEFGATLSVHISDLEIPYPYVTEGGDEFVHGAVQVEELARLFPTPRLSTVGDEVADGLWIFDPDKPRPLALFDAVRTDFSLKRLAHYTGTNWRTIQPWILLTNYQRYVDGFVRFALEELTRPGSHYVALHLPGGRSVTRETAPEEAAEIVARAPWQSFQMPAYNLQRDDGQGITIVNIGVGPSNAKNITDHLAVLRPNCWLMIGHCGGLRQSQVIGDYVLAHGYLRRDRILDDILPPEVPVPALAEVQLALQEAAARVTGDRGDALKRRLRTGTVVTYDDRNWELRWSQERRRINLSRAIAVDMESGTLAAQGYRLRVPYGTLLCVSDKPLHGEIKLPGAATSFYQRAVGEHLAIALETIDLLRGQLHSVHSRKLRAFDEPVFR
jgi:AMP nucleosidase